ncbi:DUF4822 domain-containing protein [Paenibacillus sp. HJL G12]|uniref:DUF4822 domain-containing protein n=1 Tax=Paenibacillus dendrobii TaxID=2691084 RepID=A0A7X3LG60_9BACL|nr:DUF4822 domain-containing protein [Paenibacillus dendrobii]MWV42158.1 DUF4822 domain-containing protein [Paenibacillus dendrobii]
MNKYSNKLAALMLAASLGAAALPFNVLHADAAASKLSAEDIQQAVNGLVNLHVLQGYEDGSMEIQNQITRAELAKMVVETFNLQGKANVPVSLTDANPQAWYYQYAAELVGQDIMQAKDGRFDPRGTVSDAELVQIVSKALNRDVSSWVEGFFAEGGKVTRGQVAYLLNTVYEAIISPNAKITTGQEMANILSSTDWQGTRVYDKDHNDLTKENSNFIGLAKYDAKSGRYEFFDAKTGQSRGDKGTFFITNDGKKRILISESMNYQAVVDMTEINKDVFTYQRMGKDAKGNDVEVFVEHVPYKEKELSFTDPDKKLESTTGSIVKDVDGDQILGSTRWHGTKVLDENGKDVTEYNSNFISLAKFDDETNKYEFFNVETGESRGDYGYFDVTHENKIRAHASIGKNKYGIAVEITELNNHKFTYKRTGKDKDGKDITVFVEHEPYQGDFDPKFTF